MDSEVDDGWKVVKPVIYKDTWKARLKRQAGYMPRPKPMRIHPDKKKKMVMAKVLYEAGWGSKQLAIWFKTNQQNIPHWVKQPTPKVMMEFENNFRLAMKDYDAKGLFVVKERMMELIPEEDNLQRLVAAGNFFRGPVAPKNQTNVQNNIYGDLIKKYQPQEAIET